jgi:hypothetical protein
MKPLKIHQKEYAFKFNPWGLLAFFGVLLTVFFFGVIVSDFSNGTDIFSNSESLVSVIFVGIAFLGFFLVAIDLFMRQKVSHIGYVLGLGGIFSLYSLIRVFLAIQMGSSYFTAAFFFGLAFVASLVLLYFFVKKALDGDADWRYQLAAWLTLALFYFGVVSTYSILDLYGSKDNPIFWIGLISTRIMIFLLVTAIVVSVKSDYDPNPILLNEFGSPIDALKVSSIKENESKAKASAKKDSSNLQNPK